MPVERQRGDTERELRLEGPGLVIVGGFLLAAIVGSFYLGRWVERRAQPPQLAGASGPGPLSQVVEVRSSEDADGDADFFDGAAVGDNELEPEREARAPQTVAAPTTSTPPVRDEGTELPRVEPAPGRDGDFYVQVFAGRDRRAAETLVGKLKTQGYEVRVFSEREGQGALFKVRVGGYPTEAGARRIATNLKDSGYSGAWVTRIE